MPLQKTPPLGWPHSEAEKYRVFTTPPPPPRPGQTFEPPPEKKGCGCAAAVVGLLVMLAIIGAVVAILVAVGLDDNGGSGYDTGYIYEEPTRIDRAGDAFVSLHPGWTYEFGDEPDPATDAVRLVVWDGERGIGRLAYMEPDDLTTLEWREFPLIDRMDVDEDEAFLDAFAVTFSEISWSYVRDVMSLDLEASPETWTVSYRIQDPDSGEWTEILTTVATRDQDTGAWTVFAADSEPSGSQDTTVTPTK